MSYAAPYNAVHMQGSSATPRCSVENYSLSLVNGGRKLHQFKGNCCCSPGPVALSVFLYILASLALLAAFLLWLPPVINGITGSEGNPSETTWHARDVNFVTTFMTMGVLFFWSIAAFFPIHVKSYLASAVWVGVSWSSLFFATFMMFVLIFPASDRTYATLNASASTVLAYVILSVVYNIFLTIQLKYKFKDHQFGPIQDSDV